MQNNHFSKIYRIFSSILPISKLRYGYCLNCGECCKLPNRCFFLRGNKKGEFYCAIYPIRPFNCRRYPRTEREHITKKSCGFKFKKGGL